MTDLLELELLQSQREQQQSSSVIDRFRRVRSPFPADEAPRTLDDPVDIISGSRVDPSRRDSLSFGRGRSDLLSNRNRTVEPEQGSRPPAAPDSSKPPHPNSTTSSATQYVPSVRCELTNASHAPQDVENAQLRETVVQCKREIDDLKKRLQRTPPPSPAPNRRSGIPQPVAADTRELQKECNDLRRELAKSETERSQCARKLHKAEQEVCNAVNERTVMHKQRTAQAAQHQEAMEKAHGTIQQLEGEVKTLRTKRDAETTVLRERYQRELAEVTAKADQALEQAHARQREAEKSLHEERGELRKTQRDLAVATEEVAAVRTELKRVSGDIARQGAAKLSQDCQNDRQRSAEKENMSVQYPTDIVVSPITVSVAPTEERSHQDVAALSRALEESEQKLQQMRANLEIADDTIEELNEQLASLQKGSSPNIPSKKYAEELATLQSALDDAQTSLDQRLQELARLSEKHGEAVQALDIKTLELDTVVKEQESAQTSANRHTEELAAVICDLKRKLSLQEKSLLDTENMKAAKAKLDQELELRNQEIAGLQSELASLHTALQQHQAQGDEASKSASSWKEERDSLQSHLRESEIIIERHSADLAASQARATELVLALEEANRANSSDQSSAQAQLDQLHQKCQKLEQALHEALTSKDGIENQLEKSTSLFQDLNVQAQKDRAEIARLNSLLSSITTDLHGQQGRAAQLEEELSEKTRMLEEVEFENKMRLEDYEAQAQKAEAQIVNVQQVLAEKRKALDALRSDYASLKDENEAAAAAMKTLVARNNRDSETIERLTHDQATSRSELVASQSSERALSDKACALEKEILVLQRKVDSFESAKHAEDAEFSLIRKRYDQLLAEKNALTGELSELHTRHMATLQNLQMQEANAGEQIAALRKTNEGLVSRVDNLKAAFQRKDAELQSREAAAASECKNLKKVSELSNAQLQTAETSLASVTHRMSVLQQQHDELVQQHHELETLKSDVVKERDQALSNCASLEEDVCDADTALESVKKERDNLAQAIAEIKTESQTGLQTRDEQMSCLQRALQETKDSLERCESAVSDAQERENTLKVSLQERRIKPAQPGMKQLSFNPESLRLRRRYSLMLLDWNAQLQKKAC